MEAADFEKVASRTLNSKQWSKMRDVVEMIRVKVTFHHTGTRSFYIPY